MNVQFKESFARDLRSVKEKAVLARVKDIIQIVEQAQVLDEISGIKKLKGGRQYSASVLAIIALDWFGRGYSK